MKILWLAFYINMCALNTDFELLVLLTIVRFVLDTGIKMTAPVPALASTT